MSVRTEQIENYNPAFDYVRAIASLMVLFTHAILFILIKDQPFVHKYVIAGLEALGIFAVEFFFALSGILLGRILYKQFESNAVKDNIRIFVIRRWMRTLPVYYLGLVAYLVIFNTSGLNIPSNLPAYFIFLQNLVSYDIEFFSVSWSLCIEEIFYVLFPAMVGLLLWKGIHTRKAFLYSAYGLIIFCFLSRQIYLPVSEDWAFDIHMGTVFRLDSIAVGVLTGLIFKNVSRPIFISACFFMICCGLTFTLAGKDLDPSLLTHQIILQICFTGMPWACSFIVLYISQKHALYNGKILRFFADISYALYVIHMPMLYILMMAGLSGMMLMILFIPSSIAISYFIFMKIETPFLRSRPYYNYSTLAKTVA